METTQILVIISLSCLLISLVSSLFPKIPIIVRNAFFLVAIILLATSQIVPESDVLLDYLNLRDQKGWNEILAEQRLNKPNRYFSKLADKLGAKKITNLPSPRVLWVGSTENDIDSLPSAQLPKKYMIKANHGSGWNILVDLDKEKPQWGKIKEKCKNWLNSKYGTHFFGNELHYHDIPPRIFVEEFIDILGELKFHCFNGQVVLIEHYPNRWVSKEQGWYTRDWENLKIHDTYPIYKKQFEKPVFLEDLIKIIEREVPNLNYVRFDVIQTPEGYKFGEYTLTPNALHIDTLKPPSFEKLLGRFLESGRNDFEKINFYVTDFYRIPEDSPLNSSFSKIKNSIETPLIHVVMVCTPNYYKHGAYGANTMKLYCDKHGYLFTLVSEPIKGLHVNFTKNSAALDLIGKSPAKFIINCDADIDIKDLNKPLTDVFDTKNDKYIMQAPSDEFNGPNEKNSIINAGFVVWKNCSRAREIN